jgi:peptidoglycan/LPS O-acetylase OafA/YrhL
MSEGGTHRYVRSLDGLRALAVLIVLLAHARCPYPSSGGVGVDIFFVLSGFLITSILVSEFQERGRISYVNFYARRFLRLGPCLFLTCLGTILVTAISGLAVPWTAVLAAMTYTTNWLTTLWHLDLTPLAHCWSLAIEEQYYLIWPLAITLLELRSTCFRTKAVVLFLASLGIAVYRYCMVGNFDATRIYVGLDTHMDGLVLGGAIAYLAIACRNDGGLSKRYSQVVSYGMCPMAVGGLLLVMGRLHWSNPLMGKFGFACVGLAAGVLIFDLVGCSTSWIRSLLEANFLIHLGRISYGLYLIHLPIYLALDYVIPQWNPLLLICIKLLSVWCIAWLSYHWIELRFLSLKKHFALQPVTTLV